MDYKLKKKTRNKMFKKMMSYFRSLHLKKNI